MYTLLFAWTLTITAYAPLVQNAPSDVPPNHWAFKAVDDLYKAGILHGYPEKFEGNRTVSRAEMAAAIEALRKGG